VVVIVERSAAIGRSSNGGWSVNSARSPIDAARDRGIVALPGFEANSAEGVHLLVLFECETDFADVNAAIGACGANPGAPTGTTGKPFAEILEGTAERGGLVVPAHVNVANGGMLTGRAGPPLVKMVQDRHLHAIAASPGSAAAADQQAICSGTRPYDRPHPLSVIHADDVNHPDKLSNVGATTWLKGSGIRLESLKLAVRTPATRVAVANPVAAARSLIQQISWTGGFLDGVTIPFAAALTALIGGRGTGKSTVIESIRYVLGIEPFSESARRDHDSIVSGVLRSGTTVRLEVDTISPAPRRYTIERSVPNPPIVRDSSCTKTDLQPSDVIGMVEIFGQHELADLAHDKASVAQMLERFAGTGGPDAEHRELLDKLKNNREKIKRAEKQRDDLDAELTDIPRLQEHVDQYVATDLPTRLSDLQQLAQDEAIFTEGMQRVAAAEEELQPLIQGQIAAATGAPLGGVAESPEIVILARRRRAAGAPDEADRARTGGRSGT
jgi:hypothetical protein